MLFYSIEIPVAEASKSEIAGGFGGIEVFSSLFEDCEFEPPHPAVSTIEATAISLFRFIVVMRKVVRWVAHL